MIAHDDEYKNHIQRLNVYVERVIGKDAALVFYQKRRADCKRNAGNIGYRLKEQAFFCCILTMSRQKQRARNKTRRNYRALYHFHYNDPCPDISEKNCYKTECRKEQKANDHRRTDEQRLTEFFIGHKSSPTILQLC